MKTYGIRRTQHIVHTHRVTVESPEEALAKWDESDTSGYGVQTQADNGSVEVVERDDR